MSYCYYPEHILRLGMAIHKLYRHFHPEGILDRAPAEPLERLRAEFSGAYADAERSIIAAGKEGVVRDAFMFSEEDGRPPEAVLCVLSLILYTEFTDLHIFRSIGLLTRMCGTALASEKIPEIQSMIRVRTAIGDLLGSRSRAVILAEDEQLMATPALKYIWSFGNRCQEMGVSAEELQLYLSGCMTAESVTGTEGMPYSSRWLFHPPDGNPERSGE